MYQAKKFYVKNIEYEIKDENLFYKNALSVLQKTYEQQNCILTNKESL